MSSTKKKLTKEKVKIKNKNDEKEEKLNEIKFLKRTLENCTHEVLEDFKLKTITSWRKSKSKFLKSLIFNFLTFGILYKYLYIIPNYILNYIVTLGQLKNVIFF